MERIFVGSGRKGQQALLQMLQLLIKILVCTNHHDTDHFISPNDVCNAIFYPHIMQCVHAVSRQITNLWYTNFRIFSDFFVNCVDDQRL